MPETDEGVHIMQLVYRGITRKTWEGTPNRADIEGFLMEEMLPIIELNFGIINPYIRWRDRGHLSIRGKSAIHGAEWDVEYGFELIE